MSNSVELSPKDVAQIIRATFPAYRKRKVWVRATESVTLLDLNWSGGTRSEYRACTLDGKALGNTDKYNAMAPWDARQIEGVSLPIMPGACVVRGGHFCGKESVLTIYVHPSDMPRYLPG
jgi:hypothetical protein